MIPEPGGIHIFYFFFLVSAKTVTERKGDTLQVAFGIHVEILCSVPDSGLGVHRVENVTAFQLEHGPVFGKGIAQGGIHEAYRLDVVASLYGLGLPESGDFHFQVGPAAQLEGIYPLADSYPLLLVERRIIVCAGLVVL